MPNVRRRPFTSADVKFSVAVVLDADNNENDATPASTKSAVSIRRLIRRQRSSVCANRTGGYYLNFFFVGRRQPVHSAQAQVRFRPRSIRRQQRSAGWNRPFKYASWKRGDAVEMVAIRSISAAGRNSSASSSRSSPVRNTTRPSLITHEIDLWLPVPPAFADRVKNLFGIGYLQHPS